MATPKAAHMYNFKDITTVPGAKELVDIVLSQTQRRTPTVVHPQFKISRIRGFYMRKVKFCQQTFHDKFTSILSEFPRLDDIHPFYADLCNVLYDRDHYKIALGQINTVRGVVDHVAKDYVRLMKYADSPYKCKMLKRAAMGRMCTAVRKLVEPFKYLEEVRQHLSRLPAINPNTKTLVLAGYPNVGKSSFINAISHANVEVQPYAFTTKSLYVGHFDYRYCRWQVIDTPGILDSPLASRNTIELTAITALAHIQAAVLFLVDMSENCGFSVEKQVALFHSIKVLFRNKPLVIVLNKCDVVKCEALEIEKQELIKGMVAGMDDVTVVQTSCLASIGIDEAKNKACDMLLTQRMEAKLTSRRISLSDTRLHSTEVTPDAAAARPPQIPPSVLKAQAAEAAKAEKVPTLRDVEEANGGAGVYSVDLHQHWQLKDDVWRYDVMPEVFDGKNVLDFVDPEIDKKLRQLEKEEDALLESYQASKADMSEWNSTSRLLNVMHKRIRMKHIESKIKTNMAHVTMPRRCTKTPSEAEAALKSIGYNVDQGLSAKVRRAQLRLTEQQQDGVSSDSDSDEDMVVQEGASSIKAKDIKRAKKGALKASVKAMKRVADIRDELLLEAKKTGSSTKLELKAEEPTAVEDANPLRSVALPSLKKKLKMMSLARSRTVGSAYASRPYNDAVLRARDAMSTRVSKAFPNKQKRSEALKLKMKKDTHIAKMARAGEADRFIGTKRPKHLFSGKRGVGKTDRR